MRTINGISSAVTSPSTEDEELVFACEAFIRKVIIGSAVPVKTRMLCAGVDSMRLEITYCMTTDNDVALACFTCSLSNEDDDVTVIFSLPQRRVEVIFDGTGRRYPEDDRRSVFSFLLGSRMKIALLTEQVQRGS